MRHERDEIFWLELALATLYVSTLFVEPQQLLNVASFHLGYSTPEPCVHNEELNEIKQWIAQNPRNPKDNTPSPGTKGDQWDELNALLESPAEQADNHLILLPGSEGDQWEELRDILASKQSPNQEN